MLLNEEVESAEELPNGRVAANLVSKKRIIGDALLYAVGRSGNVDGLNLSGAGVEADERGRIKVDENYRTAQPHIFAVGDVIGLALSNDRQGHCRPCPAESWNCSDSERPSSSVSGTHRAAGCPCPPLK